MSNQATANEMFAGRILRALYRDLSDSCAKRTCNELDRALRSRDRGEFARICGTMADIVREDDSVHAIRERLQVISLIRFPIWELDDDLIVESQRTRVLALRSSLTCTDREIWRAMGSVFCNIVRTAIADIRLSDFRHGPGVVSETSDALLKRAVCFVDPRVQRRFRDAIPDTVVTRLRPGISKTVVVPKDHKSRRVIAAEPTWTQWCQQGVKGALYRSIPKHPIFRGKVSFDDQGLQRGLLTKPDIATIDLSDASDTLKMQHLLMLTQHDYAVREFLTDLRTPLTLYKGRKLPTVGLYPMGAAVCFPIETLVFGLATYCYCIAETGRPPQTWGVFGDDIIVDSMLAGGLCSFLSRSGFKPNLSKTFIGGVFVESCGVMLYKGIDVTPMKVKKGPPCSPLDESNITFAEYVASQRFFPHLREALRGFILSEPIRAGKTRWNRDLQRLEQATLKPRAEMIKGHPLGYPEALLRGKCDIPNSVHHVQPGWRPSYDGRAL